MRNAVIVDIVRTSSGKGKLGGALSSMHPVELLKTVLDALVERTGVDPAVVDDVMIGCVGQAGEQALNIGRQAVLAAGWPESVPATTIDRQCGSSQQAVSFAAQAVMSGFADVVVAGGVESMSRVPMGTAPMGKDVLGPSLQSRYPQGLVNQGVSAELVASRFGLARGELDAYAARSHALAAKTAQSGGFEAEIIPVTVPDGDVVAEDETIRPTTTTDGLAGLSPAFCTAAMQDRFPDLEWSVTPGNSSPLTDGASGAIIMGEDTAAELGLKGRAVLRSFSVVGDDPVLMLTGPIPATRKVLDRAGLSIDDIDAFEVNEAFASVPLAWCKELGADPERVNPRGGAIALGHPLGASGTRLLATLVNHLEQSDGRYGLQTMCEGNGMANATLIERV